MANTLLNFYSGVLPDDCGRTLDEMWSWSDEQLENCHNYIQWMFPSTERSAFNASAPVLSQTDITEFLESDYLQKRMLRSLETFLRFLGFECYVEGNTVIVVKSADYSTKTRNWVTPYNHNYLRITRILKCLSQLGLQDYAMALLAVLETEVFQKNSQTVGEETAMYWRNAVM